MSDLITPDLAGPNGFDLARQAIERMAAVDVPPTPANYEVWVHYSAGLPCELKRQIDRMLADRAAFTPAVNDALFDQYFGTSKLSQQMMLTGERIAKEITDVVSLLKAAGDQSGAFSAELEGAAGKLEQGLDARGLRDLVGSLTRATAEMASHNRQLSTRLEEAGREVTEMRETLQMARAEALSDGLTGLANRKHFDQMLRLRLSEAQAQKTDLCLMMCDIDHFKRFNDTWGHQTGDQVIRFVSSVLRAHAGGDMMAARYGGEEFGLIMPRTSLAAARQVAETIRQMVESKVLVRKSTGEDLGRITISSGIALMRPGESPSAIIERADDCLYVSKRNGRNRVTADADRSLAVA